MIRPKHLIETLTAVAVSLTLAASAHAQAMNLTIDGVQRQALILAPMNASDSSVRLPLVFAFHGHGGNMIQTAAQMRFDKVWPEAVVVYMQGLPTKTSGDPDGDQPGWQHEPGEYGDRDLKFFDAVLAKLRHVLPVDENRVYATGFSNGAIFTYLLWGTRAKAFAALAPVAGEKFPRVHLSVPIPLLHIAGMRDANVPFEQQLATISVAREVNRTTGSGHSCGEYCTAYDSNNGAPVIAYIHPAGHVYPRYASEMIADFFKQHRRREAESRTVPGESAAKSPKLPLQ